jgi:hypothetical protein
MTSGQTKGKRLHRPEPKRTEPIRNPSGYFREGTDGFHGKVDESNPNGSTNEAVNHGVNLGYKVIDEYLKQGQRTAEQIRKTVEESFSLGDGPDGLVGGLLRLSKDLAEVYLAAMTPIIRKANQDATTAGHTTPSSSAAGMHGVKDAGTKTVAIAVRVDSRRRTKVTVQLYGSTDVRSLTVYPLRTANGNQPALTKVSFAMDEALGVATLDVYIPDKQPIGQYAGVVINQNTQQPTGMVSVHIT